MLKKKLESVACFLNARNAFLMGRIIGNLKKMTCRKEIKINLSHDYHFDIYGANTSVVLNWYLPCLCSGPRSKSACVTPDPCAAWNNEDRRCMPVLVSVKVCKRRF